MATEPAGEPDPVKMVQKIMEPVGKHGRRQPARVRLSWTTWTAPSSRAPAAYEKRGVAVMVPIWDADKCIQCNQCSYVCPHATIRPYALTEEEAENAPAAVQDRGREGRQGQGRVPVRHRRLPPGLHGLRRVRRRVPG